MARAQFDSIVIDAEGNTLQNITVSVYDYGTTNLVTIYSTKTGGGTLSNPITTPSTGLVQFWADPGSYDVFFHDGTVPARIADRTYSWESINADGLAVDLLNLIPIGTILPYGGSSAPTNFLMCDGSEINRTTYSTLYNVIGTAFGTGNGSSTFNVPDLRGRAPIGAGQGSGLTNRVLGTKSGSETHQLSESEIPSHVHSISGIPTGNTSANAPGNTTISGYAAPANTFATGGGGSHNNMQPVQVVNNIIRYQ